jgi:hypothetical protein
MLPKGRLAILPVSLFNFSRMQRARLETQLNVAVEPGYCSQVQVQETFELISELRKILNALRRKLQSRQ